MTRNTALGSAVCSMTGYATAARELAWGSVSVELRSVNHRYLDVSFRMPDELRPAETALREAIAATVTRGKVECRVAYALRSGAPALPAGCPMPAMPAFPGRRSAAERAAPR